MTRELFFREIENMTYEERDIFGAAGDHLIRMIAEVVADEIDANGSLDNIRDLADDLPDPVRACMSVFEKVYRI